MACGSHRKWAVPGLCPHDGGGLAIAHVDARAGGLVMVGELGWLALQASCQLS